MEISITIEGFGMGWSRWRQLIHKLEALDFAGIYKSDHFTLPVGSHLDHIEAVVALSYLAQHNARVHFGTLVSPVSFRDPVMLARQAMALDDMSGSRMILGVGTGWQEREHTVFGYHLGTIKERIDRLEEGLEVITRLIRNAEAVTFEGHYFQVRDALLMPRPQRPTPVMIGASGPKRMLPLVARYADIWNNQASVEIFAERSALLDKLLEIEGRQPGDVKRTVAIPVMCWRTENERDQILADVYQELHDFTGEPDGILAFVRERGISGTPDTVIEQIQAYEKAGAEEFIIQHFPIKGDIALDILDEQVLPYFR